MFYGAEAATHYVEEVSDLGALPLTLRTIQTQWAYAVEWRRRQSAPATAMLAAVTIHVLEGAAGVGILEPAGAAFAHEEIVSAASHPACVHLVVPCAEDFGALVVRNASPNGASRAIVMDISFVPLDDPHASSFPPMLSSPSPVPGWARYYSAEGLTPVERLRAARFDRLDSASLVRWADGLEFQVHPDDQLSRVVFVSGTYEPNTLAVLRTFVGRGDTFIDVGGNAGIVSLAAASWVGPEGRVHAFEPSTREYTRLLDTVARNRLHQVAAHHVALGARREIGALHVASPPHAGLNTFGRRFSYGDISAQGTEDVAVRTLDDVAAEGTFGKVAAIKIDVEGMELDVLQGARALLARDHPALVIEVNDRALEACGASVAALEDLLIASGYTLWEISEDARLARLASLRESASENIAAVYG
jgi:FkbM family methyltransferase